jgi:hypothetical protein
MSFGFRKDHLMKKNGEKKESAKRILSRRLARELSPEDLKKASGGLYSYCGPCCIDDTDENGI